MHSYKLHMSLRSPFARRVRLLLEELGVAYEPVTVDVFVPPQWFLQVNPLARVPALELPTGEIIADSNQIVAYFKEAHPAHALFNTQGVRPARALNWSGLATGAMDWTVTWFLESLKAPGMRDEDTLTEAEGAVVRAFAFFNEELRGNQKFLAGTQIGVWDLDLGAAYGYSKFRMKHAVEGHFPELEMYFQRLMTRDSFKKTVPPS